MDLDADNQHGLPRPAQAVDNLARRRVDGTLVDRQVHFCEARRNRNVGEHHVARNLEIHGTFELQRHVNRMVDAGGRGIRIIDDGARLDDLLINLELRLERFHLVVDEHARLFLQAARTSGNHHQRRLFGVRAGHRIDHVQTAGAVGDKADAEPIADSRGAIGCKTDRRLVAQRDELKSPIVLEGVVEVQHEVARDAEDVADAVGVKVIE